MRWLVLFEKPPVTCRHEQNSQVCDYPYFQSTNECAYVNTAIRQKMNELTRAPPVAAACSQGPRPPTAAAASAVENHAQRTKGIQMRCTSVTINAANTSTSSFLCSSKHSSSRRCSVSATSCVAASLLRLPANCDSNVRTYACKNYLNITRSRPHHSTRERAFAGRLISPVAARRQSSRRHGQPSKQKH